MPEARRFLVIAHRGASAYAPENTFAAFDKALAMGVNHVELDVHFTADGHIIVIHDDTVDRTTDGAGSVASHTLAQIRSLDAGSWFAARYVSERLRTLGEVLERYKGRLRLHIEIKAHAEGLARRTADLVRGYGVAESTTITSFWKPALEETRAYAPELPVGWLVSEVTDSVVMQACEMGLSLISARADSITPWMVDGLREKGLLVRAWGVADEGLMRSVVDAGADGMTIDFPDKLVDYLKARGV